MTTSWAAPFRTGSSPPPGAGVKVWFFTDAIGSYKLPTAYCDKLREAGIRVSDRDSQRGPKFRFQINYRNHRKTVIVDRARGFHRRAQCWRRIHGAGSGLRAVARHPYPDARPRGAGIAAHLCRRLALCD
ncbi:hypothetical protein ACFOHS_07095 [Jhaorihella thermophila]